MQVRLRNLNVKTKYLVVTYFQRRNSRALPFALFHRRDNLPSARRNLAQFVKFGIKSAPNRSRITCEGRRVVSDSARNHLAYVRHLVQLLGERKQQTAWPRGRAPV